jgi:hypothetical protein
MRRYKWIEWNLQDIAAHALSAGELGEVDYRLLKGQAMASAQRDDRSPHRNARDEQIANESQLPPPELPADAFPAPLEAHPGRLRRRPLAVAGVVENGLVRPLDPSIKLPEHARVIIVAAETP